MISCACFCNSCTHLTLTFRRTLTPHTSYTFFVYVSQWLEERAVFINRDESLIKRRPSKDVKAIEWKHFQKVRVSAFVSRSLSPLFTQITASKVKHTCAHTLSVCLHCLRGGHNNPH